MNKKTREHSRDDGDPCPLERDETVFALCARAFVAAGLLEAHEEKLAAERLDEAIREVRRVEKDRRFIEVGYCADCSFWDRDAARPAELADSRAGLCRRLSSNDHCYAKVYVDSAPKDSASVWTLGGFGCEGWEGPK